MGHASWVNEKPLPMPSGPPHVGNRNEMLSENKKLFAKCQEQAGELQWSRDRIKHLENTGAADRQKAADTQEKMQMRISELTDELAATRAAAKMEEAGLNQELASCQAELAACAMRLQKTHEALGISADKARQLESSKGRLQIDLDGTLSSLEEAQRKAEESAREVRGQ